MGFIISVTNHKGGVAKTTTTINLGHALARAKKKVLAIDLDLQCNTTSNLFGEDRPRYGLYDILDPNREDIDITKCIYGTPHENFYILPNIRETAAIESHLIRLPYERSSSALRSKIRDYVKNDFDFTLIDCPPNLGMFVINALIASDFVIVPNETGSKYSMEGLAEAVNFIEDIRENGNADLRFLKVLLTKVDQRMMIHKATMAQIKNFYPSDKIFKTIIPTNTDIQKAELTGKTIFAFRSNASGALAYKKLAQELINILKVESDGTQ
jgi:chromosome partitioning protein